MPTKIGAVIQQPSGTSYFCVTDRNGVMMSMEAPREQTEAAHVVPAAVVAAGGAITVPVR